MGDDKAYAESLALRLSKATGKPISTEQMLGWIEGGPGYDYVDAIAREYMGRLYNAAEEAARMLPVLDAKLAGLSEATIGGIKFKNLQQR